MDKAPVGAQRAIPTMARRRKRQPGRARSPAKSQPCGQRQFAVNDFGLRRQSGSGDGAFGRTGNIRDAKDFRACESGVALRLPPAVQDTLARWTGGVWPCPAAAMSSRRRAFANPMPDGFAALLRPGTGALRAVFGATAKTATGTGALPSQVPAGRPMAVWGGRTGQWVFESQDYAN
jgi:hypothetical protein